VEVIAALREQGMSTAPPPQDCPEYEPLVAAMVDGSIEADESERLHGHLDGCPRCCRVLVSVGLFRHEIDRLTKARAETREPPSDRLVSGDSTATDGDASLLHPKSRSARLVLLVIIAGIAIGLGLWLGRGTSPDTPTAGRGVRPAATSARAEAGGTTSAATDKPDGEGLLNVRCRPRCDAVTVDSARMGPSPVLRRRLPQGLHSVQLVRADTSKRVVVRVHPEETTSLVVEMEPPPASAAKPPPTPAASAAPKGASGHVAVTCTPACTGVRLDGEDLGASPVMRRPVTPGHHRLELQAGSISRTVDVFVEPGETQSLHLSMAAPTP
jgi:Zn-finger nucleic acid-binding protein